MKGFCVLLAAVAIKGALLSPLRAAALSEIAVHAGALARVQAFE